MTVGAGIRVHAGLSGGGKSHLIKIDVWDTVRAGHPVMVIDRMREWDAVPADVQPLAGSTTSVEKAIEKLSRGMRLAIIRPAMNDGERAVEDAARWAMVTPGHCGLAIPEAHRSIPKSGVGEMIGAVTTEWRHHDVAVWCDTQRLALLNTDLVELSRVPPAGALRLFAMCGKNDLKAVEAIGGKELVHAVEDCADRYARHAPQSDAACASGRCDHQGWHVRVGVVARPPFEIVRA